MNRLYNGGMMPARLEPMNRKPEPLDRLMTVREAANLLGLSRTSVYRLIWKGSLSVYRPVADAPRLRLSEVVALMEGSRA